MRTKEILFLFCVSILIISCKPEKNIYTVQGSAPENQNGSWAYVRDYDTNNVLDSVQVIGDKFTIQGQADTTKIYRLILGKQLSALFIPEGGAIIVNMNDFPNSKGTILNDRFAQFQKEENEMFNATQRKIDELKEIYKEDEDTYNSEIKKVLEERRLFYENYIKENKNNGLGKFVFVLSSNLLPSDEVQNLSSLLGDEIKNSDSVKKIIKRIIAIEETTEGKMFTDFTIENGRPDGTSVSLSDYVGKGKYVLVDFWASWCGPCIRETPIIAEVYNKYKGDKFEVLGVAVWEEKREDTLKAMEAHGIIWPQILDAKSIPTELYGIKGIPHIILFGPDGTILARGLRGDKLKEKVAEAMK